jgi:DNA-binding transcriptional MerR regulator
MVTATQPATYTSAEVCRQTGLTYRQLDRWTTQRYLRPEQPTGHGSGHAYVWTQAEIDIAAMMARLILLGVTAQQAAWVARDPQERWRWLADVIAVAKGMQP